MTDFVVCASCSESIQSNLPLCDDCYKDQKENLNQLLTIKVDKKQSKEEIEEFIKNLNKTKVRDLDQLAN